MALNNLDRLLAKIRTLLALAEDPAASPKEAELAFMRAQRLMDEHAIQEWQLHTAGQQKQEKVTKKEIPIDPSPLNLFKSDLAHIIARNNRCEGTDYYHKAHNGRVIITSINIIGVQSDIDKVEMLWTSMELYRANAWKTAWKNEDYWTKDTTTSTRYRRNFYVGFQDGIFYRYKHLHEEKTTGESKELTLTLTRLIDQYINSLNLNDFKLNKLPEITIEGYDRGREASQNIALGMDELHPTHHLQLTGSTQ